MKKSYTSNAKPVCWQRKSCISSPRPICRHGRNATKKKKIIEASTS
jgi:hypothetical protein